MSAASIPENVVVLYFIACLICAIIAREINRRISLIPYTPLLILLGILLGAVTVWGQISEGVDQITRIHPHGILMILLPILIFESSYNAKLSIFKANLLQILLLAIPGVIVTVLMLAFSLKFIIGYDDTSLDMNQALVLGCILGTTDPVAVVALLKELGAPLRTNMLVEMESLLNDGVAMVFFTIFLGAAQGKDSSAGDGIVMFLRLAIGGPALGLSFGIAAVILTNFFTKGKTFFMSLILLTAFTVFFTAEKLNVAVSGLLGLVALGFFFSVYLKNLMTQEQEHAVHTILGYIQHIDETFIFFLTGTITGDKLVNNFVKELEPADIGHTFIFYVCMFFTRLLMVTFMALIVRLTGSPVYPKEMALQIWGGLRGGLSLALALVVFQDPEFTGTRAKTLILFHTAAQATLTLVFNGATASFIVKWVKLIENTFEREKYQEMFEEEIQQVGEHAIEEQKQNETMSLTFWDGVLSLLNFRKHEIKIHVEPTQSLLRYKVLRRFVENLQGNQGQQYLAKSIYGAVVEASEVSCEQCGNPIDLFSHAQQNLTSMRVIDFFRDLQRVQFLGNLFLIVTLYKIEENFQVISLLILVLNQTIGQLSEEVEHQPALGPLIEELQSNLKKASDLMFEYKSKYTGEIQKISQRQAAIKILVTQIQYVDQYIGSFITIKEGIEIKQFLFHRLNQTYSFKMLLELDSGPEYILESSFRGLLTDKELIKICQSYEIIKVQQGQIIITFNEPVEHCFLILEGIIEEEIKIQNSDQLMQIQYSTGNLVGVPNVIDKKVESVLQMVAKTECSYLKIPIPLMREIFESNKKFEDLCYKESLATFLVLYHSDKHKFNKFVHLQLFNWAMKAKLVKSTGQAEKMLEELLLPTYGAFVFEGEFISLDGKQKFGQFTYVEQMRIQLKPIKPSIALVFNTKLHMQQTDKDPFKHTERSMSLSREESVLLEHPNGHH